MNHYRHYTSAEVQLICQLYRSHGPEALALRLRRSRHAIHCKARELKLTRTKIDRPWTLGDIELLLAGQPVPGRSPGACWDKAYRLRKQAREFSRRLNGPGQPGNEGGAKKQTTTSAQFG